MITDPDPQLRSDGYAKILEARKEVTGSIRQMFGPQEQNFINFESDSYFSMINWTKFEVTEPPCLQFFTQDQLEALQYSNEIIELPEFKLEKLFAGVETTPGVSEEWGSGWKGTNFIVEIEETASASVKNADYLTSHEDNTVSGTATINGTSTATGPKIIVRTEEVLIVGLVLMLWVCAIVLFFNRWGKIRMLEPYQPKFQQQHRSSCPLVDLDSLQAHPRASVSRMSMGMVNQLNMPTCQFATYNPSIYAKGYTSHSTNPSLSRPRQNSVFVGPSATQFMVMPKPPRKTRSAMDLHSMVLDETAEQV